MKGGFPSDNENVNEGQKTKAVFHKNRDIFKSKKINLFEEKRDLLDEGNIKDL